MIDIVSLISGTVLLTSQPGHYDSYCELSIRNSSITGLVHSQVIVIHIVSTTSGTDLFCVNNLK